ncbi:MAG: hypothetical protein AAFN13_09830 [Bacteroidota bacterium]
MPYFDPDPFDEADMGYALSTMKVTAITDPTPERGPYYFLDVSASFDALDCTPETDRLLQTLVQAGFESCRILYDFGSDEGVVRFSHAVREGKPYDSAEVADFLAVTLHATPVEIAHGLHLLDDSVYWDLVGIAGSGAHHVYGAFDLDLQEQRVIDVQDAPKWR